LLGVAIALANELGVVMV